VTKVRCDQQRGSQRVKIYGSLCTAAISQRHDSSLRLWHLAKMIDEPGSGVVSDLALRDVISANIGTSKRHVRRLLTRAQELGWLTPITRHHGEQVWLLASLERVSRSLGVTPSQGALIPAQQLRKLKTWRGAAWAAFLGGRPGKRHMPITRKTLARLSGIDERSQRNYQQSSRMITARRNIAISNYPVAMLEGIQDVQGRPAFKVGRCVGWQLPNSYTARVDLAPRGMARRISKKLSAGGVLTYAATRGGQQRERLFYGDHQGGVRAMRREDRAHEVFAYSGASTERGSGVWEHIAA
jgi:hypothetical protein